MVLFDDENVLVESEDESSEDGLDGDGGDEIPLPQMASGSVLNLTVAREEARAALQEAKARLAEATAQVGRSAASLTQLRAREVRLGQQMRGQATPPASGLPQRGSGLGLVVGDQVRVTSSSSLTGQVLQIGGAAPERARRRRGVRRAPGSETAGQVLVLTSNHTQIWFPRHLLKKMEGGTPESTTEKVLHTPSGQEGVVRYTNARGMKTVQFADGHVQQVPAIDLVRLGAGDDAAAKHRCQEELRRLAVEVMQAEAARQALKLKEQSKRTEMRKRQRESRQLKRDQKAASKCAKAMRLVKFVTFTSEARPSHWRDVGNFVTFQWVVAVGERDAGTEPEVLQCAACRLVAREGLRLRRSPDAKGAKGAKPSVVIRPSRCPVTLSVEEAKAILDADAGRAALPKALDRFEMLKAGLGALPRVLLEKRVQDFFDDPETGLIRAKEVPVPSVLSNTLRPYQLTGFHWLVNNARNGLGCILADDMGLGKTIQAIALCLFMKQHGMLARPMLVVVPKGLLSNWSRELEQWTKGELTFQLFHGGCKKLLANARSVPRPADAPPAPAPTRKRKAPVAEAEADILLTSYQTFRAEATRLMAEQTFAGMILDEAQNIKNHSSQVAQPVKQMAEKCGDIRVALSGTPVENRLGDLHSQFEYILPGFLANSKKDFDKEFDKPLAAAARGKVASPEAAAQKQRLLQRLVAPFIMRRLKSDKAIAADLPDKVEQNHDCEPGPMQAELYKALQEKGFQGLQRAEGIQRHGQVLAMLHALRQVCNHPACLDAKYYPEGIDASAIPAVLEAEASGKCAKLHELMECILAENYKVLIFSNYLGTIDMLEKQISEKWNSKVLKIVGSMDRLERERAVDAFQSDPSVSVLLLSLQAGGVGLNLTAATHVIHFDRCYNPAKEAQATDRAHRIGQTSVVFVHRLIMKGTFEERLHEIMQMKQKLSDLTITSGEGWIADLSNDELRDLFSLQGQGEDSSTPAAKRRKRKDEPQPQAADD